MIVGSLFAGIGGFDIAARWMGWRTAWFSEVEPYACNVLKKHWPDVPNYGDIRGIKAESVEPIDILCGGFPCQDISLAGKGAGIDGERSGLWSEYARLIDELRPRYVVAENVPALRTRGIDRVLKDLCEIGYDAEWHCIPASYVGAPHRRDRIWIVAYPGSERLKEGRELRCDMSAQRVVGGRVEPSRCCADVADRERAGLEGHTGNGCTAEREATCGSTATRCVCDGEHTAAWWASEPDVGRVANGIPARVDRLRCLGNAIVPQVAYKIFRAIEAHERN